MPESLAHSAWSLSVHQACEGEKGFFSYTGEARPGSGRHGGLKLGPSPAASRIQEQHPTLQLSLAFANSLHAYS